MPELELELGQNIWLILFGTWSATLRAELIEIYKGCLLPIAYCLLPIAYCLLPIALFGCILPYLNAFGGLDAFGLDCIRP